MSDQDGGDINKGVLYGRFYAGEDRKARIYDRGVMQSLDLADDEMNVNTRVDRSRRGIGVGGALVLAAAVAIPPAGILGAMLLWAIAAQQPEAPQLTPPVATQPRNDHAPPPADDSDFEFFLLPNPPGQVSP